MKIFQLNILSILFLLLFVGLGLIVPSFIIQSIWNSTLIDSSMERDLSIVIWQAALLWGSLLSLLYTLGVFKLKVDFKTIDSIDLEKIKDPDLKDEIEKMKVDYKEKSQQEKDRIKAEIQDELNKVDHTKK